MKKTTRFTALLLVVVMLVQTFAFAAQISDFGDFPKNSWSTEAVTAAVENGLLIGRGNNRLDPKGLLTRAEMAAIVTRAFGATVEKDISLFKDVKENDWYSSVVAKAYNMLVMQGTGDNTFAPKNSITREEVFLSLARVLHIDSEEYSLLDKFSDKTDVADWSKNAVTGMVGVEYLNGYEDGTLRPKGKITREELAQVFHNIFKTYISEPGTYSSVAPTGSVIIRAPGVTLENVTINGDLVLADGIGAGDCRLNNVTVNGRIIVRGGEGTVYFVNVKSTGKVIINDVNGTVNFHNYRTDVPFKDNLVENTPATFLKPIGGGGGGGGGGGTGGSGGSTPTWDVKFTKVDQDEAQPVATIAVNRNSTIQLSGKTGELNAVPETGDKLGFSDDYAFYGWVKKGTNASDIIAKHGKKDDPVMTKDEIATHTISAYTVFVPLYVEKSTGIIKGGGFDAPEETDNKYHVNHEHHDVTADALMNEGSDDTTYPKKWEVTDYSKPEGDPDRQKTFYDVDDLVDFINNLPPDTIVKVEVSEYGDRIKVTFKRFGDNNVQYAYAVPGKVLEASRRPEFKNEQDNEYFYTQTGWALDEAGTQPVDIATKTIDAEITIYAVYSKEPIGILVMYFFDANGDGTFDEATEQWKITQNYQGDTHDLLKTELPEDPVLSGEFAFLGWATSPENAKNEVVITYPYTMSKAGTNPVKLYASFISTVVNAEFTDDDTYGSDNNQDTSVKVDYNTGAIIGNIPTFELKDEYKEKYYFFGWVDTANNNKQVSTSEIEAYMKERAMTDKADMSFTALYLEKTVVTFYDLLGNKFGDEVYYKPDENVAKNDNVPSLGNYEELYYFVGWSKEQGIDNAVPEDNRLFKFEEAAGTEDIELYPALGMRYEVVFSFVDSANAPTTATKNAYAIPGDKLEASRIPTALGFTYNGYVYTFANWTLSGTDTDGDGVIDAGAAFDFANTDIVPPTTYVFSAVYTKELADVVVTFVYGCDVDGVDGDDIENFNKSLGEEVGLPTYTPSKKATHQYTYTFAGWALSENGKIVISEDGTNKYTVVLEDIVVENGVNTIKLYPVYTSEDVEYKVILTVETPSDFRAKDGEGYKEWTDVVKTTIYGGSVTLPGASSDEIPVRPGTNFKHWYTADETSINVTELKVEPVLPTDGTLPETTITLYAYMECEVKFVDEVGNQKDTVTVQYNTEIPTDKIPDWVKNKKPESGFERNTSIAAQYTEEFLNSEKKNAVHEIPYSWFNLEDFGEWDKNNWAVKPTKWIEFDENTIIKSHETVELSIRRINLDAYIDIDKVQNLLGGPVKLTVPYEVDEENPEDGRFLTTVKDAIFMNETFVLNAYDQSGAEDKLFDKLRNKNLMAFGSKEILNVNKTIEFYKVVGEETLAKVIDKYLEEYLKGDGVKEEIDKYIAEYLNDLSYENIDSVTQILGKIVNTMLANDPSGTIKTLESVAHNIAENKPQTLTNVIEQYVRQSLTDEEDDDNNGIPDREEELRTLLNNAFVKYCTEHESEFHDFLETIIKDLLVEHPNDEMKAMVTELAIEKVKAGQFKDEIKKELSDMSDEELTKLLVKFVTQDFSLFKNELKNEFVENIDFVGDLIYLIACEENPTFEAELIELAEATLSSGGSNLKDTLKNKFHEKWEGFDEETKLEWIDNYLNDLSDAEMLDLVKANKDLVDGETIHTLLVNGNLKIDDATLLGYIKDGTVTIDNATLLGYIKNGTVTIDNAKLLEYIQQNKITISNGKLLDFIKDGNIAIDDEKLLQYIQGGKISIPDEELCKLITEKKITVPADKLCEFVKFGKVAIPDETVVSLIKTSIKNGTISSTDIVVLVKNGQITIPDEIIDSIIYDKLVEEALGSFGGNESLAKDYVNTYLNNNPITDDDRQAAIDEITEAEVNKYKSDVLNSLDDSSVSGYADEFIQKKLDATIISENYDAIIRELDENTIASVKADIIGLLKKSDIENNKDTIIGLLNESDIENYKEDLIANLTVTDIANNKTALIGLLNESDIANNKTELINNLTETDIANNKTAIISVITPEQIDTFKDDIIDSIDENDIKAIRGSIIHVFETDLEIREKAIDAYVESTFNNTDDLDKTIGELLDTDEGKRLIADVIEDYLNVEANKDKREELADLALTTLEGDSTLLTTAAENYIKVVLADPNKKEELLTTAVEMLSKKDGNGDTILDKDKNGNEDGSILAEVKKAILSVITDKDKCDSVIKAYVDTVIYVEEGEEVDFTEIIVIFCAGDAEENHNFRNDVIKRFIENLEKLEDDPEDEDNVGEGVEIVEEMIDAILEKMGDAGHVDEEIIRVVLGYVIDHKNDDNGKEIINLLVESISGMIENAGDSADEILGDLDFEQVNDLFEEVDKFKKQFSSEEQFEVNPDNLVIIEEIYNLALGLEFNKLVETYIKPKLPIRLYNEVPFYIAEGIYDTSYNDYIGQLESALDAARNGGIGYVDSGITINFNPVHEIYVPLYEYALEEYEKACDVADNNTGRPGKAYDRYLKENPYVDDLIELLSPEKLFNEVSSDHSHELEGSGYAIRDFQEYYQVLKSAAVLMDDMFLWYLEEVDFDDIEEVLLKAEERVLGYTNLLVSLANSYANDGIPDDISDIYDDILANALASGDFEKIVGKVEGITNKDVEYYIDRVLESRYPELAYDKGLAKVGARAATILELYIDSKFNRYVTDKDYGRIIELLEFAYEDLNNNVTVDYVMDKVMDGDDKRELEFRGNTVTVTRTVAATNDND